VNSLWDEEVEVMGSIQANENTLAKHEISAMAEVI
jgi:hypothetical protein